MQAYMLEMLTIIGNKPYDLRSATGCKLLTGSDMRYAHISIDGTAMY
jgi:hypothetical protein